MSNLLFHEIYGTYYSIVNNILSQQKSLTAKELDCIIRTQGFDESPLQLLPSLTNQRNPWFLLMEEEIGVWMPITQNVPPLLHSALERRWLKTLLKDPRLLFFLDKNEIDELQLQLHDIEPLFTLDSLTYYDQFKKNDNLVELETQQAHFKRLLKAIYLQQPLKIEYQRNQNVESKTAIFLPFRLEYSPKNNLFRLKAWRILQKSRFEVTLNINRILTINSTELAVNCEDLPITSQAKKRSVTCILVDKRQALKRSMLHFADYYKVTQRLDESHYELTIHYHTSDETELLIRLLSFGPFLTVTSPSDFVGKIKRRIEAQARLMENF